MIVRRRSVAEGLRAWLLTFRLFRANAIIWNVIQTIRKSESSPRCVRVLAQEHLKKDSA